MGASGGDRVVTVMVSQAGIGGTPGKSTEYLLAVPIGSGTVQRSAVCATSTAVTCGSCWGRIGVGVSL
jgi:hypothetical protein